MMRIQIDREADAAYIRLADGKPFESEEVGRGVILDFDERGSLIAIELPDASKNLPVGALSSIEVMTA
jgi:uncharacterized protein YuzE